MLIVSLTGFRCGSGTCDEKDEQKDVMVVNEITVTSCIDFIVAEMARETNYKYIHPFGFLMGFCFLTRSIQKTYLPSVHRARKRLL